MGYLKGKSALMMFDKHANLKYIQFVHGSGKRKSPKQKSLEGLHSLLER